MINPKDKNLHEKESERKIKTTWNTFENELTVWHGVCADSEER